MEKVFEEVLDQDEKILKVIKPHKGKFYTYVGISSFFYGLIFALLFLPVCFIESEGAVTVFEPIMLVIPAGVLVLTIILSFLFSWLYYKKTFYAYSNKRVLIRTGIIGVDYKSLDLEMIGAVDVNVTLIDKIVRKNTGSISFGSMASPMGYAGSRYSSYRFSNIVLPYDEYKVIKNLIAEKKEKKI